MSEKKANWFKKGEDVFEEKRKLDSIAKQKKERGVPRFRLKEGEEALIIFVDDTFFRVWEHNLKIDGNWGHYYTCTKDFKPCPICIDGYRPTYTAYLTIIDTRKFTRADGSEVQNRKILFPAKGSTILRLADLKKKYNSLVGKAFTVKRYSSNDPNCGTDFFYEGDVNIQNNFGNDAIKPLDYMKILAPPTEEELASIGIGSYIAGSEDDVEAEISDDDLEGILE